MPKIIAAIIELLIAVCALWLIAALSTFLHELGHAIGYMVATGDTHWHIRVGWGKRLLRTKTLAVNLLVLDGLFTPAENKVNTRAKLIATLSGGPAVSLLLALGLAALKASDILPQPAILADGAADFFLNTALFINVGILLAAVIPGHYLWGQVKGMETDGRQIVKAIRRG